LIAEAEGGTLVLDEVDSLSLTAQAKLLRFLQNGEYRPLGSSRTMTANVRVIAATNADLLSRVKARLFRDDLYYRLSGLSISIPPLRERNEDIIHLASHFTAQYAHEHGQKRRSLSEAAFHKLLMYDWPGNVRELEGLILRSLVLTTSDPLQPHDISLPVPVCETVPMNSSFHSAKDNLVRAFERTYLMDLLTTHRGNVSHAAKAAGKQRRTLQRMLRKHCLDRNSFRSDVS
jgi:DNA-binding NtrC family response regulator